VVSIQENRSSLDSVLLHFRAYRLLLPHHPLFILGYGKAWRGTGDVLQSSLRALRDVPVKRETEQELASRELRGCPLSKCCGSIGLRLLAVVTCVAERSVGSRG